MCKKFGVLCGKKQSIWKEHEYFVSVSVRLCSLVQSDYHICGPVSYDEYVKMSHSCSRRERARERCDFSDIVPSEK